MTYGMDPRPNQPPHVRTRTRTFVLHDVEEAGTGIGKARDGPVGRRRRRVLGRRNEYL